MTQKYCKCAPVTAYCCPDGWKLYLVGSRFTHPAGSRYAGAPIEGKALAVAYALQKTRYYVLGCTQLIVATDHKPLVRVFNDRSLSDITSSPRLVNLNEKTLGYRFQIVHVPGKSDHVADAESRNPNGSPIRLALPGGGEAPETDVTSRCPTPVSNIPKLADDEPDFADDA